MSIEHDTGTGQGEIRGCPSPVSSHEAPSYEVTKQLAMSQTTSGSLTLTIGGSKGQHVSYAQKKAKEEHPAR